MTPSQPSAFALPDAPLRIAAAQCSVVPGDVDANAARAAGLIRQAAAEGVRLVVFAEKFLTGYEPELIVSDPARYTVAENDPRLAPIAAACRETGTAAVVGAASSAVPGELRVSVLVFGADGTVLTRYDKQHLFTSEKGIYSPGEAGCTLELDGWRLGLAICYDTGFPEHARDAALDGCHAYLASALFGTGHGRVQRAVWFPARALDNTCYTLLANHIGATGGWDTCGGSGVWAPDGTLLIEAGQADGTLAVAELDPAVLRAVRGELEMLADLALRDAVADEGRRTVSLG
ncbi:carbon-nitrogen hydrolase family protein [Kitasatospora sp. NPDC006697]|uniref:carbon-nitrogen hydrolase family protein n=1 Tax=Kitasatospora sp. NPDC006697 TaxID=3364020 RepID=UPI0036C9F5BB